jgi:hypothetical protein
MIFEEKLGIEPRMNKLSKEPPRYAILSQKCPNAKPKTKTKKQKPKQQKASCHILFGTTNA